MNWKMRKIFGLALSLGLILNLSFAAPAQKTNSKAVQSEPVSPVARLENRELDSRLMGRPMPYRLIYPKNYDAEKSRAERYPVLYLLHGLSGHFDNWADKTKIKAYADNYNFLIVMPEGGNGWYTDSATENSDRYESYIVEELIPEIDKKFRTVAGRNRRFIAGLSMGGYGSIKFGLKYPQMFSLVGSFSGALGAAEWTEKEIGTKGAIADSILKVYGPAGSKTRRENDIFQMVRDLSPEQIKNLPFIYLDCGTEDFLIGNNLDFAALLREKKVPHEFRALPGKHNWAYWDSQVKEFLRLSERFYNERPKDTRIQETAQTDEPFCTLGEQKISVTITLEQIKALPPGLQFLKILKIEPPVADKP